MAKIVDLIEKRIGKDRAADALVVEYMAKRIEKGEIKAFCVVYVDDKDEVIKTLAPADMTHDESLRMIRGLGTLVDYVIGFARTVEGKFI